jgi:hypothetical protein
MAQIYALGIIVNRDARHEIAENPAGRGRTVTAVTGFHVDFRLRFSERASALKALFSKGF